jgi:hypothetical protein
MCVACLTAADCATGESCSVNKACVPAVCTGAACAGSGGGLAWFACTTSGDGYEAAQGCDDGNPCTTDTCDAKGGCQHLPASATCTDGTACTAGDACAGGTCKGTAVNCDDGKPCTADSCDGATGCVNLPAAATCEDGDACTSGEACKAGQCAGGEAKVCDDKDACTIDSCDVKTGQCGTKPDPKCTPVCSAEKSCPTGCTCTQMSTCIGDPVKNPPTAPTFAFPGFGGYHGHYDEYWFQPTATSGVFYRYKTDGTKAGLVDGPVSHVATLWGEAGGPDYYIGRHAVNDITGSALYRVDGVSNKVVWTSTVPDKGSTLAVTVVGAKLFAVAGQSFSYSIYEYDRATGKLLSGKNMDGAGREGIFSCLRRRLALRRSWHGRAEALRLRHVEMGRRHSRHLPRIIHDSFCCKLALLAPRVFRPRCSLRRTVSATRCAAPGASAIRFGNRAFATKSRESSGLRVISAAWMPRRRSGRTRRDRPH